LERDKAKANTRSFEEDQDLVVFSQGISRHEHYKEELKRFKPNTPIRAAPTLCLMEGEIAIEIDRHEEHHHDHAQTVLIKRRMSVLSRARRGGKGVIDDTREGWRGRRNGDFIEHLFTASTHDI